MTMAKGGRKTFGDKPKGKAKDKGAKGKASKRKTGNKIKTKAKTATRRVSKRQQQVAKGKATAPNESPTMGNRELDEAAPAAIRDEMEAPTTALSPAAAAA